MSLIPSDSFWRMFVILFRLKTSPALKNNPLPCSSTEGCLLQSDQERQKPAWNCNAWHGLFKMPWESRHLPLESNHRVRTRVTFILARTGTRRDHGDHLIRLSAQWSHKNVPGDSYSHPRLLRWGNGHQQQHLSLYVCSLTVCILIAQGNKGWRQISEE